MVDPEADKLSAFQLKERKERTVFVGNLPVNCPAKPLKKLIVKTFTKDEKCSVKVEKIWFRSIATEFDNKKPERAKIVTGLFGAHKDNKNAYVLMQTKEQALEVAKSMN